MNKDRFAQRFSRPCHVVSRSALPLIRELGLLSPTQILKSFAEPDGAVEWAWFLDGARRWYRSNWCELSRMHRPDSVCVRSVGKPDRIIVLRDQHCLGRRLESLQHCLRDGMVVGDWIAVLNERVYLFRDALEAKRFRAANAQNGELGLLEFDPRKLYDRCLGKLQLGRINGGSIRSNSPRGRDTYRNVAKVDSIDTVAEITVVGAITVDDLKCCCISQWLWQSS